MQTPPPKTSQNQKHAGTTKSATEIFPKSWLHRQNLLIPSQTTNGEEQIQFE